MNKKFVLFLTALMLCLAPMVAWGATSETWNSAAKRFRRWVVNGIWEKILEQIVDDPDYEWLMIDASHINLSFSIVCTIN